jgi:nucleotide-binding universal stress UspA family protein
VAVDAQVKHVLVPLDGSEFALAALPTARALAERFAAELHTISVSSADDEVDKLSALGSVALGVAMGDSHVRVVVDDGDVAESIEGRASELGDCVVCLSTHGRGRLSGAAIGSVARSLVQRSSSPVVALGPSADRPGWSPSPRWPAPLSVSRIVACVDGSATSEEVLPVASGWARALGMSLTILTVIEDAPAPIRPGGTDSRYGASGDAQTYIDELVRQWEGTTSEVTGQVVRDPLNPASGIRAHLAQQPAGLVALTSHARTGVQRILLGAAAANIVHASVSPCLVVPLQ